MDKSSKDLCIIKYTFKTKNTLYLVQFEIYKYLYYYYNGEKLFSIKWETLYVAY